MQVRIPYTKICNLKLGLTFIITSKTDISTQGTWANKPNLTIYSIKRILKTLELVRKTLELKHQIFGQQKKSWNLQRSSRSSWGGRPFFNGALEDWCRPDIALSSFKKKNKEKKKN